MMRRRFPRAYLLGSLLLLAASLHPPTAYSAPGDPPSGSPAGAVYELPLQQGRADAAPKGKGGDPAGDPKGGDAASHYRSENDFGSSSRVPGLATAAGGSGGGGGGNPSAAAPAAGEAAPGADRGAASDTAPDATGDVVAGQVSDAGNTSLTAGLGLLGAIVLVAVGAAVLSRRYMHR